MRRRGNKSTKVPGVKLRPAQPGASSSRIYADNDAVRVQDSQAELDSDDTRFYDPTPRPFAGVVLCATGITDKLGIFKQAMELGATATSDFTTRVTHLVAEEHGSAKYRCALEHKIPILQPSWITESYNVWLHGDDVDFDQSVKKHRLPIFSGLVICVSGIPDVARRTEISKIVMREGGTYVKVLQRPVTVTHLLCSGDEETDKMFYAEKFNKHGEADIKLVWEEWFWDSLEFGGRFDENRYQARQPRPKPRTVLEAAESSSQPPDNVNPTGTPNITNTKGPSNSGAEDGEESVQASVKKPVGFQRELWRSVLAPRGYTWNEEETVLIKSPTKGKSKLPIEHSEEDGSDHERRSGSVLSRSSFRRANSFAQLPSKQPLRRLVSSRSKDPSPAVDAAPTDFAANAAMEIDTPGAGPSKLRNSVIPEDVHPHPPPAMSIFSNIRFAALGEANHDNVRGAIRKAGGTLVESVDLESGAHEVDIIIVRLVSGSNIFASVESQLVRDKFRTECWLEKCLHEDTLCVPDGHITFTPVGVQCPVSGAENIRISFSGFDEAERFFMTRMMKVLGLTLLSNFSKRATHLLCPSAEGLKFDRAREWGVPVVGLAWLEEMKRSGVVPDAQAHLVSSNSRAPQPACKPEKDPKGKGKATENDSPIADITNCVEPQSQTQDDSQPFEYPPLRPNPPLAQPMSQAPTQLQPLISATPSLSSLRLDENGSFGKPSTLLQIPIPRAPDKDAQVSSSFTVPEQKEVSDFTSITSVEGPARVQAHNSHSKSSSHASKSAEPQPDIVMVMDSSPEEQMNVPSSETPSPVKPAGKPGKGKGRTLARTKSSSKSPSKYYPPAQPIDAEATKALHESLTSLLGKRRSEESADGTRKRGDRASGKRLRPTRTKSAVFNEVQQPPPPDHAQAFNAFEGGGGNDDSFGFGRPETIATDLDAFLDQSIIVTYEDPEQRDEKRKLMRLLESDSHEDGGRAGAKEKNSQGVHGGDSGPRRRSTRKSVGT
ncbi:hypothetical protein C8R42DRAFT_689819 [Lentinula raphanica]|nr:hypothetical protein C8R42DRAFT_689819 [Lentinula raphanica]